MNQKTKATALREVHASCLQETHEASVQAAVWALCVLFACS